MKFALAYYLLLIYSTVILKPVIPIVEDSLAHCFAEAYHIATVHAKYGSNHLDKEVADTNDNSDNGSNNKNVLKEDDATAVHVVSVIADHYLEITKTKTSYILRQISCIQKILLSKIYPPPKFSV